ncbi:hypothetical protein ACWD4O_01940 [Streptomyces sp. NPDC002623]
MTHRISAVVSAFGVLATVVLLIGSVREYRSGASGFWIAAGGVLFLITSYALIHDVRRLRAAPTT